MTAPLFYVEAVPAAGAVVITGDEARHAVAAMRLQPGETILVGDGVGALATCAVTRADRRTGLELEVLSVARAPAARELRVVQAIPKGDRADLAVELLTETGVSTIVPWISRRTIADWRGKQQAKTDRWQRIARAAAKQSRRSHVPVVAAPCFGIPEIVGQGLVLHEDATDCLFDVEPPTGPVTVLVGPEGGLATEEVAALVDGGARAVNLGPLILRTSTAGAAACVWIRGFEKQSGA